MQLVEEFVWRILNIARRFLPAVTGLLLVGLMVSTEPAALRPVTVTASAVVLRIPVEPTPSPPLYTGDTPWPYVGMWLGQAEIEQLPQSGQAWELLREAADTDFQSPDISDKDDQSEANLLAAALVYARTGSDVYRHRVLRGLEAVIGTEGNPERTSILAIGRNTVAYVVAADLVDLPADPQLDREFRAWLLRLRDTTFSGDGGSYSLITCHEKRPNNFGTHCGASRVAIDRYLKDDADLERAAQVFAGWLGNREVYADFNYGALSWQADPENPVGINPVGAMKEGQLIDGALPEEMRRVRGREFSWPPRKTGYAWEALQGAIVQAELLSRAGYPAWEWESRALLRAVSFLHRIGWQAEGDDGWQPWLVNHVYGTRFPAPVDATPGKNMGWTNWTHATIDTP